MIKIESTEVFGWETAIRGMRNPMNSWDKSDSEYVPDFVHPTGVIKGAYVIGLHDLELMKKLAAGGSVHAKYRRMIHVSCDITSPLYWWKEFDTYKVGTVANSCSTMHKIHAKEFTLDDFSHEHLTASSTNTLQKVIEELNMWRDIFLDTKSREAWWQMIQLLPSSYNQKRTVDLNYEVLSNIYESRKEHKLDEWRDFCEWIANLPYSDIIWKNEEKENV